MHVTVFADAAGLTGEQVRSLTVGGAEDGCSTAEADLIRMCDALHASADLDDALWSQLRVHHTEEAMIELLLLAGFYRTTSYLANALALPLEAGAARFADHGGA